MNFLCLFAAISWLSVFINAAPPPKFTTEVPLPGRKAVYFDEKSKEFTAYYGDDVLPLHMAHLQQNQEMYPQNLQPMAVASRRENSRNRRKATGGVPTGGEYLPGDPLVRDEKHPAMFVNPEHLTTTTVQKLPQSESSQYHFLRLNICSL